MLPLSVVGAPLEMTKRRWRELMHALYEIHFDPRKDEELKQSKIEIENKLPKILKLVKDRRQNKRNRNSEANSRKESELIELIEDFHKQYQFVYDRYDHLRGQLSQTVNGTTEEEGYFTATSSSDSDSEKDLSSEDIHISNNGIRNQGHADQDLEDLKQKLTNLTQEKESTEFKEKLAEKEQQLSTLAKMNKLRQKEFSALMEELVSELCSLNLKLDAMCTEKQELEDQVENKKLQCQVSNLEKMLKEMDKELSELANGVESTEEGFVSEVFEIKRLVVQMNNLKINVDCLNAQKKDTDEQMVRQISNNNGSALHENLSDQVNKMKREMGSIRKKNTELESKIKKKVRENSEFLSQIENLKKELASKILDLQKMQKDKEDSLMRAKNFELEVHNLHNKRGEIENQMARQEQENGHLREEMDGLQGKMVKMEKTLKEREDQFSALQKKLENGEDDKSAQIVALMTQINHLEEELESKTELERQMKIKNQDINRLTEEKKSLKWRISELEKKLEDRGDEFSNLQNEMSSQIVALTREVSQLQQEMDMKRKLDEQISSQDNEINQLGEEKESLQAKILELEITLTEREDEIADLQRRLQLGEKDISARVLGLSAQISHLKQELSTEKKKSIKRLTHMENQNSEMTNKILDQQLILKQQEDTINKLREDCKLVKGRFLQAADRKMDEVAEEFRKNFEDKLRILSQRIRVAEQLHVENKESCKRIKERCEQEHPGLEVKLTELMSSSQAGLCKISKAVDEMMNRMEHELNNFEGREGSFCQRLTRVSNEIQVAKNWVRWTMDEMRPWKNESISLPFGSMDEKEQDKVMKEKVKRLEAKVNKEKGDKVRLMRGMYELQKKVSELEKAVVEKDEGLLRLGKEKVEAIRQLCMWIDYHQSRFNHLKQVILGKRTKNQRRH